MKRALAIAVALCTIGVLGLAQFSGEWSGAIRISASTISGLRPGYLQLNYKLGDWTIGSRSVFGFSNQAAGTNLAFTEQRFTFKGTVGPFTIDAGMNFNAGITTVYCEACIDGVLQTASYTVTPPQYMSGYLNTSFDFGGVALGLNIKHWVFPYECFDLCDGADAGMTYTLTGKIDPINLKVTFLDCCEGIELYNVVVTMNGVSLCCGITYDFELGWNKEEGFEYALFTVKNAFGFCCGISFDVGVKFTIDAKEVSLTPKFAGLGEACFKVYADLGEDFPEVFGFTIYGWTFSCTLQDCYKLTVVTILNAPPADDCGYYPSWYTAFGFLSGYGEFEYIQIDACGAGCCGGKWTAYFRFYFGEMGTLFGITRIRGYASIPLMANLAITGTWTATVVTQPMTLTFDVGWRLTF